MSRFNEYIIKSIGGVSVKVSVKDAMLLRQSIKEELDAINDYSKRALKATNEAVKNLFLEVAREEKVHFGEFEEMLEVVDPEHEPAEEEGEEEVKSGEALDGITESFTGFGKSGTIQKFGNDIIITDAKQRSISLSKQDICDLLKKLKTLKCKR